MKKLHLSNSDIALIISAINSKIIQHQLIINNSESYISLQNNSKMNKAYRQLMDKIESSIKGDLLDSYEENYIYGTVTINKHKSRWEILIKMKNGEKVSMNFARSYDLQRVKQIAWNMYNSMIK